MLTLGRVSKVDGHFAGSDDAVLSWRAGIYGHC